MLKDKSGQLMLISAFMLAMMVVTITLMLNNVIFASNLAYVGFMDQTRYDDISFKQATAREMNYADNTYESTPLIYTAHMTDYTDAINRITSIKGRYVELASGPIPNPAPFENTKNTLLLSVFSKNSKVSYGITTGNDILVTPIYKIELQNDRNNIICDGVERVKLTAKVTWIATGLPVTNEFVKFAYTRNTGKIVDGSGFTEPMNGWPTDASGNVVVYYSDLDENPGMVDIYAYIGATKSNTVTVSCISNVPPTYTIELAPPTPPETLTVYSNNIDNVMLTATVKDGSIPVSGVLVKFYCDRGTARIDDIKNSGSSGWMTGQDGTVVVYFYDTDKDHPGDANVYAYIEAPSGTVQSINTVKITCQPLPTSCAHKPSISVPVTVTHGTGSKYFINVPSFDPITNEDIIIKTTDVTSNPINDAKIGSPAPFYTQATKILKITTDISGNPTYTITMGVTFKGVCVDNPSYTRDGTITITGTKNSATATLTFP
jgi:hypothetical protein